MAISEAYPGLTATVVELSNVVPITKRFITEAGAEKSVEVVTGDITGEDFSGQYDVAVLKNFIPVVSPEHAQSALKKIARSLAVEGTLYIVDNGILDDSRVEPVGVVVNSLYFLNVFDDGGPRTEGERRQWLAEAGFIDIERSTLSMGLGVMVARKSRSAAREREPGRRCESSL